MSDQCSGCGRDLSEAPNPLCLSLPHWHSEVDRLREVVMQGQVTLVAKPEILAPIPMRLCCERCGELHIDEGDFATRIHHTHSCQKCGLTWRPAVVPTVGVKFLPGFRNSEKEG